MLITIHQPLYMPWLGFFHKTMLSDEVCILDNVQFSDGDYIHRNRIKSSSGYKWLTLPVDKKNHFNKSINQIQMIGDNWAKEHARLLEIFYADAPYFSLYFEELRNIITKKSSNFLVDLDMALILFLFEKLEIETNVVLASTLKAQGKKSELIVSICKELKASTYLSGQNGINYLNVSDFNDAGIEIEFQNYLHPVYPQLHSGFLPNMSVIDLLFNCGPKSKEIILMGNRIH
jgi:hypothetical protein